jgi:hypothetical protein
MVESEILGTSLFAQISSESAALVAAGGVTDVPAGQVLAQAGDHGGGMFVVLDGTVVGRHSTVSSRPSRASPERSCVSSLPVSSRPVRGTDG